MINIYGLVILLFIVGLICFLYSSKVASAWFDKLMFNIYLMYNEEDNYIFLMYPPKLDAIYDIKTKKLHVTKTKEVFDEKILKRKEFTTTINYDDLSKLHYSLKNIRKVFMRLTTMKLKSNSEFFPNKFLLTGEVDDNSFLSHEIIYRIKSLSKGDQRNSIVMEVKVKDVIFDIESCIDLWFWIWATDPKWKCCKSDFGKNNYNEQDLANINRICTEKLPSSVKSTTLIVRQFYNDIK